MRAPRGEDILTAPRYAFAPDALRLPEIDGQLHPNGDKNSHIHGTAYHQITAFEARYRKSFPGKVRMTPDTPDIRAVWEPARLQNITRLLHRMRTNPDDTVVHGARVIAREQVLHWLEDNPFLRGLHYISAMECALRIPVFVACLTQLDNLLPEDSRLLAKAVYSHAWWTASKLSLHSSLGNHTIAESMGLVYAGAFFRHLPEGQKWLATGTALLRQELYHQILPDGGGAEQSTSYHRFVLDLYAMSCDLLEGNGLGDCEAIREQLHKGEFFLRAFRVGDEYLAIGDSDDGHAISRHLHPKRPPVPNDQSDLEAFPQAGYCVVHTSNRCRLIFDHGPLGLPPLYNHGHADALAVWLIRDDRVLLGDAGTFRYNGAPAERAYFKGTRAHNTVCIDGLDQAHQVTGFIWSQPYRTYDVSQTKRGNRLLLTAAHDGYTRLPHPVRHTRRIFWEQANFIILDSFSGTGEHTFELNFHIDPRAEIAREEGWWRIARKESSVRINMLSESEFKLIQGQTNPLQGWHSPAYGVKEPAPVLQCIRKGRPDTMRFITVIATEGLPTEEHIQRIVDAL